MAHGATLALGALVALAPPAFAFSNSQPQVQPGSSAGSDISQMSVLTFGNKFSRAADAGKGVAMPLSSLLNATYALGYTSNPQSSYSDPTAVPPNYPYPIFAIVPVTSEYQTHAALWDHIVDNPAEDRRVFAHALTYETNTGQTAPSLSSERVDLYLGVRGYPGAGSIWAGNSQTHLYTGYTGLGAAGWEFDVTNQAQHRGDGFGQVPYTSLNSTGVAVDTLSKYRNAQAFFVDGKLEDGTPGWNRGYVVYKGAINAKWGCSFCDYGGAYATLQGYGAHMIGLDFTNASLQHGVLASSRGAANGITFVHQGSIELNLYDRDGVFSIDGQTRVDGSVTATGGFVETLATPASSTAPCRAGQFADDANYHYVCVAANKWRRAALSDF